MKPRSDAFTQAAQRAVAAFLKGDRAGGMREAREAMKHAPRDTPKSRIAHTLDSAEAKLRSIDAALKMDIALRDLHRALNSLKR